MSNSSPIPQPKAVIIAFISLLSKIVCSLAFWTFNIFPLKGKIAWCFGSLPLFAEPPAESPSTIYISFLEASLLEQSVNFSGIFADSKELFRLVVSLALIAATLALEAIIDFSTIILAISGFSSKKRENWLLKMLEQIFLTSLFPNLVFVCPSYWGLGCLTEIIAVKPSFTSSGFNDSSSFFKKLLSFA